MYKSLFRIVSFLIPALSLLSAEREARPSQIGREVSMPRRLEDGEEYKLSIPELIAFGKKLFCANWTIEEGGGRPLTKGTGKPLSDPSKPLTGMRAFNRISGPEANSCAGCHNSPYGIPGGGGDLVANVFVLAQRFDFATFDSHDSLATRGAGAEDNSEVTLQTVGDSRITTGMFGAGYIEMLAREITSDLQAIRDSVRPGESMDLVSKGIHYGRIGRKADGTWDTSKVEGLPRLSLISRGSQDPPSLVIRPWHQASNVVSIREFTNTAFNQHHGIQSTERFGKGTDPDGDGVTNEMSRAEVTATAVFQAALQVPGRVIPNDPGVERAVLRGEGLFSKVGCAKCHVPALPLSRNGSVFTEPNPYNPPTNLRMGEAPVLRLDLTSEELPQPRLRPDVKRGGVTMVPIYADFKLHDICEREDPGEPLDMNQNTWSPKFRAGNRRFLTRRLWGAGNEPPYFHHGLFTTMRQAVLAHAGEALKSRNAFRALTSYEQDTIIEFLKTLQVLPPGTRDLVVDENYHKKEWPPQGGIR